MATEIILPKLGQTMEQGAIVEWLVKEGDSVKRGDVLFTVESDKATLEVEASARGFLRKILVPAGQPVPVLTVVGLITRSMDEPLDAGSAPAASAAAAPQPAIAAVAAPPLEPGPAPALERLVASPRARKLARARGVDLAQVRGTGPDGRIVERDVQAFLARQFKATPVAAKKAAELGVDLALVSGSGVSGRIMQRDVPEPVAPVAAIPTSVDLVATVPLSGLRGIIAERMAASVHITARVTLMTEVDATQFVAARQSLKAAVSENWGFAPGYNDLLALAVARSLHEFPYMNARLNADGSAIEQLPFINLGLAVDTERGLLVPVIRDADRLGLRALGGTFRELVERARIGRSLPDDLSGGTFTITNLGMYGVDAFTPVINLPEAAILGVGRIQQKPVVREGQIAVRQMWTLSLAFDHRLVDGAPAARFLQRIAEYIENPYLLLG